MATDITNVLSNLNSNYQNILDLISSPYYFTNEPDSWSIDSPDFSYVGYADACIVQSDGKICVGGESGLYSSDLGDDYSVVKRFLSSGAADGGFSSVKFHGNSGGYIRAIGQQSSGKLIVAGHFTQIDGSGQSYIARLNTDGSLDGTFSIGSGFDSNVLDLKVLGDDSIICVGVFSNYNGSTCPKVAKLGIDGVIDATFAGNITTVSLGSTAHCVAVDGSGKIYVGGQFSNKIIRLNSDGTADGGFNVGSGFSSNFAGGNHRVASIDFQSSGKLIVGHWYTQYNGSSTNAGISRLNTDGTLDTSFVVDGSGFYTTNADGGTMKVKVQSDNKVLVGGWYIGFDGSRLGRLIRLGVNGATDNTFGTGFNDRVHDIALDGSGNIFVAGVFTEYNGSALSSQFNFGNSKASFGFAKLNSAGVLQGTPLRMDINQLGIGDGGEDLEDGGPFFKTNLFSGEGGIPLSHSVVLESDISNNDDMYFDPYLDRVSYEKPISDGGVFDGSTYFGSGSKYFTNMYPGMMVLCATNISITDFMVSGSTGQDNNGDYAAGNFEVSIKGKKYACFYKTCYNAGSGQPTVNHLIITTGSTSGITQELADPTDSDEHSLSGLDNRKDLYMLYFATWDSHEITLSNFQDIANKFLLQNVKQGAVKVKTCGNGGCGTRKGLVCLADTSDGGNRCTCATWRYFTAQCTRIQQALGICSGISGGWVPAITVCNQRLF